MGSLLARCDGVDDALDVVGEVSAPGQGGLPSRIERAQCVKAKVPLPAAGGLYHPSGPRPRLP